MNTPQERPLTFQEGIAIGVSIAQVPALSVLPLLRRRIGLRTLSRKRLAGILVMMLLLGNPLSDGAFPSHQTVKVDYVESWPATEEIERVPSVRAEDLGPLPFGNPSDGIPPASGFLGLFAFASLMSTAIQLKHRRKAFHDATMREHPDSWGESIVGSYIRMKPQNADPLVCMVGGFLIWQTFSPALGAWLIFSGMCLRLVETEFQKRQTEKQLDALAAARDSEVLGEFLQRFEQSPSSTRFNVNDVEVIHTQLSKDVEALIARRRKPQPERPKKVPTQRSERILKFLFGRHLYNAISHLKNTKH